MNQGSIERLPPLADLRQLYGQRVAIASGLIATTLYKELADRGVQTLPLIELAKVAFEDAVSPRAWWAPAMASMVQGALLPRQIDRFRAAALAMLAVSLDQAEWEEIRDDLYLIALAPWLTGRLGELFNETEARFT